MTKKNTDTVPAMLTPGEFVIKKKSAKKIGYGKLNQMNKTGKVNTKKEAKMPQGKGTYGSKVGRPPKKATCYDTGGTVKEEKKKSKLGSGSEAIPWKTPSGFKKAKKATSKGKKTKGVKGFMQRLIPGGETGYEKKKPKAKKRRYPTKKERAQEIKSSEVYKKAKAKTKKDIQKKVLDPSWKKATAAAKKERGGRGLNLSDLIKFRDTSKKRGKTEDAATAQKQINKLYGKKGREKAAPKPKDVSWKKATTAAKTAGVKMSDLVSQRKKHKKGTAEYAKIQNQINEFYGVTKKHEAKKMQYGGKVSGFKGGNVFDGVEFDEDRMHGGKINKKQFGGKVGGRSGGNVTSEGYPVHGGSGNYKVGE